MVRSDAPAPAHLDDALELAEILRPTWSAISEENRKTARFLNEGEDKGGEDDIEPSPDGGHSPDGNQAGGEEPESSFLDDYDLGDVPAEARPTAEAAVKRLNAAYTKRRQQDAQVVREAEQSQLIVNGLLNPETQAAVAEKLGLQLAQEEAEAELEDDEFDFRDPRVDGLLAQQEQDRQVTAAVERERAENTYVTEQISKIETRLQKEYSNPNIEFSDEEIELLYLLADEHRDQNNVPDVESAYRILDSAGASIGARGPKPRRQAPRRVGGGKAGEQTVDLSDEEARQEAMAAAGAAARASAQ